MGGGGSYYKSWMTTEYTLFVLLEPCVVKIEINSKI